MRAKDKPLVWLHGQVKTPPFTPTARTEAGYLLRELQRGTPLSLPHSRPMSSIGPQYHELRIVDKDKTWRIFYRLDVDAVVIAEVTKKKTNKTPKTVIDTCKARFRMYDNAYK